MFVPLIREHVALKLLEKLYKSQIGYKVKLPFEMLLFYNRQLLRRWGEK